jgi:hypothetical protein
MDILEKTWNELLTEVGPSDPTRRLFRLLGSTAVGVRASVIPIDRILELLVEVPLTWSFGNKLPEWRGMAFSLLPWVIPPRREHQQLVLSLRDEGQKSIFLAYCNDLVRSLEGVVNTKDRVSKIEESIVRWGRFFEKCGSEGLSVFQQAGLFAELTWLELLLSTKLSPDEAIASWKGCERNFHDFDLSGDVVEVKSSMTKEPQQITISNERQLDDRGLKSLHLFFVALRRAEGGARSLPQKVESILRSLSPSTPASIRFRDCLTNAGYLDHHASHYRSHFIIKEQMLFRVHDKFPRIIDPPDGVARIKYGVLISACRSFESKIDEYLKDRAGHL